MFQYLLQQEFAFQDRGNCLETTGFLLVFLLNAKLFLFGISEQPTFVIPTPT